MHFRKMKLLKQTYTLYSPEVMLSISKQLRMAHNNEQTMKNRGLS